MKMIDYVLCDPTGNVTVLVTTPLPVSDQPAIGAKLLELEKSAEQVGFIAEDGSLRMAGGEFCGNASMCAAALWLTERGLDKGEIQLKVSGADGSVNVTAEKNADGSFSCRVSMLKPLSIELMDLNGMKLPVVSFFGITHVIIEDGISESDAESLAKRWCKLLNADAIGLMFLDQSAGTLHPFVYVPAVDSVYWESACGSGTSAVAAYLSSVSGKREIVSLRQPGGVLTAEADEFGKIVLSGSVRLNDRKTIEQ